MDNVTSRPEATTQKSSRTIKVLTLSLGSWLTMLTGIAFSMVASRYLSKHDYATFRETFLSYDFASPLLILGLPNAVYYFLPRAGKNGRGTVIDSVALLGLGGVLFSLFIWLGGDRLLAIRFNNPDLHNTLPWLGIYSLFMMPIAGMAAVLVSAERVRTLAIYNTLSGLFIALSGIIPILVTRSYKLPVLVRAMAPGVMLPFALFLMFTAVPGDWRAPRLSSMSSMLRYAVPLGMASVLGTLTIQLHSIIVASLCSPSDFAVYSNGALELPLIGIITGSITSVIFADMAHQCAQGNKAAALALFQRGAVKSACILLPLMIFFLVVAQPFMVVMFSEAYRASAVPFALYLFVLPVRVAVYGAALMALGMTRDILVRSVFDLIINAVVCYLLVSRFGYAAAAASLPITLYLWTTPFNLLRVGRGFEVAWHAVLPWKDLSRIMGVAILAMPLAALGAYAIPHLPNFLRLVLAAALYWPPMFYFSHRRGYLPLHGVIAKFASPGMPR